MKKYNTIKDGLPIFDPAREDLPVYLSKATYEVKIYKPDGSHRIYRPCLPCVQALSFVESYNSTNARTGRRAVARFIPESLPIEELCEAIA